MTITWSMAVGRLWKNDCRDAGSLASKAAVCCAPSSSAACLSRLGFAAGEDDCSALGASPPGSFQPDAGAAADDDYRLAKQFRFALSGYSTGRDGHDASNSSWRVTMMAGFRLAPHHGDGILTKKPATTSAAPNWILGPKR